MRFSSFPRVTVADYFIYFEAIIEYRITPRPGYAPKKAYKCRVREFRAGLCVKANGRVGAIRTWRVYRLSDIHTV